MPEKRVSDLDFQSVLKILNLPAATANGHAVRYEEFNAGSTADRSRANHTGTQTAATISDFDTAARLNRLDQFAAPTTALNLNSQQISGLADPSTAQQAATKAYVDAALAGLTSGLTLKGAARAAVTTNVTIASPGATLDGLTAAANDIFVLTGQSTGSQNGPWVWNGAAAAMTRPANFDTTAEAALGSFWVIREGTSADLFAVMTNDTAVTLGTTALTFVIRGGGGGGGTYASFTTTCPVVSAGGTWTVTHNLNTRWVVAMVARTGSPYDFVAVRIDRTTVNTISVLPDIAFASGEYEVMIAKVA